MLAALSCTLTNWLRSASQAISLTNDSNNMKEKMDNDNVQ